MEERIEEDGEVLVLKLRPGDRIDLRVVRDGEDQDVRPAAPNGDGVADRLPEEGFIGSGDLARLLHVGRATLDRMKSAGKLPRHVELSKGCHRWNLSDIRAWLAAGCPAQAEWELRKGRK